jgi:hypothetical protein
MEKPHWPMGLATAVSLGMALMEAMAAMGDFPMEHMGSFLGGKPPNSMELSGKIIPEISELINGNSSDCNVFQSFGQKQRL